jgi:integrase
VNLKTGAVRVRRALQRTKEGLRFVEPKSERSRRTVSLPAFAVTSLERQRTAQKKAKLAAGTKWVESGLVFTTTIGTALDERNVRRDFRAILDAANLPLMRIHDLRHTAASLLLAQGVHPRVVMEILGHSQISITMDTYTHVMPSLGDEAAEKMQKALA